MLFKIVRLDDNDGTPVDTTIVDTTTVAHIVQQAAAIGQRLWIRPVEPSDPQQQNPSTCTPELLHRHRFPVRHPPGHQHVHASGQESALDDERDRGP
ncbi:hypothetical protein [Streptomyces mutabilis]|uniref:hypothetical protein n=1 Tax=Streptomyces mutabilis TaxID=67332 RepID=UPI0008FB3121|nr:hypothetical protein [Streptomyces mutabilis]